MVKGLLLGGFFNVFRSFLTGENVTTFDNRLIINKLSIFSQTLKILRFLVTNFFLEAKYDSDLYIFFTWIFAVLQVAWRRRKGVIYHVPHKQTGINDYPASKQADAMTTKSTTQQEQIQKRNMINHALTAHPTLFANTEITPLRLTPRYPQTRKSRHSKAYIYTCLRP